MVVLDFDMTILRIHAFRLRIGHKAVGSRDMNADFADLIFFVELVHTLKRKGILVVVASFGLYKTIQAFLNRVLPNFFDRRTICTPSQVDGCDGCEVFGFKNPQLEFLCKLFGVQPQEVVLIDGKAMLLFRYYSNVINKLYDNCSGCNCARDLCSSKNSVRAF